MFFKLKSKYNILLFFDKNKNILNKNKNILNKNKIIFLK